MAPVLTHPLIEINISNIPVGKEGPAREVENLTTIRESITVFRRVFAYSQI
jgi:hypothetical protein